MSSARVPSLGKALLIPAVLALALSALLFRPRSVPTPQARPTLPVPVVLDELVPSTASVQAHTPTSTTTPEGLKSLQPQ